MHVLVTGAAGFIGQALVQALLQRNDVARVIAMDQVACPLQSPKLDVRVGDLSDPVVAHALIDTQTAAVFHLASLVSGGAEANYAQGMRINFDATRVLLDAARTAGHCPHFLFASSIAVYRADDSGAKLFVTDATVPAPRLSYGAQKLMCEILINDLTRRGVVHGVSLRLPTVMVRAGLANTAISGWTSAIVREAVAGRDYVCPVAPHTTMACISVGRVVDAFLHAWSLPPASLGIDRAYVLEGLPATAQEIRAALERVAQGHVLGGLRFEPDAQMQSVMDQVAQSTVSVRARRLGFPRNPDLDDIVREYLSTVTP
jgi:nucleoside-diphosphate-sugar epimerase